MACQLLSCWPPRVCVGLHSVHCLPVNMTLSADLGLRLQNVFILCFSCHGELGVLSSLVSKIVCESACDFVPAEDMSCSGHMVRYVEAVGVMQQCDPCALGDAFRMSWTTWPLIAYFTASI
jgi:hypothetical protein